MRIVNRVFNFFLLIFFTVFVVIGSFFDSSLMSNSDGLLDDVKDNLTENSLIFTADAEEGRGRTGGLDG